MKRFYRIMTTPLALSLLLMVVRPASAENLPDLSRMKVLHLKTAGKIALSRNPSIAAALSRVRQARQQLKQARSLYWPGITARASYSYNELAENTHSANLATARLFDPTATIDNPDHYYTAGLQAIWILFDGFEREYRNAAARDGQSLSEHQREDRKRLLLASVADTYLMAQLYAENIKISQADQDFNQRLLEEAEARIQKGTGSLSDKLNFEIRVNAARAELLNHQKTYRATLFALASIMGIESGLLPDGLELEALTPVSPVEEKPFDPDHFIQTALENRMDLLGYTAALDASEAEIKIARSNYYPTLSLSASIDGSRTGDASFEGDDFGNAIGINLSYSLFSGGADKARIEEAKEKRYETRKMQESLQQSIVREVRQAVENVNTALAELDLQQKNARLVRQNRNLVEEEYNAGRSSLVRLNQAQRDLLEAESRLALARVSYKMAEYGLETAAGRIIRQFTD